MWWKADAQDLHRVSDRISTVYVEKSHVDRAENAVVVINKERTVRIPAAFIASLLLGPGTRITSGAMRLLADSGTAICWVGEHGVRMYAAGQGPSRGAQVILRQAHMVSRTQERLGVARQMYSMRFPGEDVSQLTMQQLRGREGTRVKRIYRDESERTGVEWKGRRYKAGDAFSVGDPVNRALSAANSALYAVSHAAIVGVGASPALGFVHTGSSMSFVHDIADLYKAEYSIPTAFEGAASGLHEESDIRYAMRERFRDGRLMQRIVRDILNLLRVSEAEGADSNDLWDNRLGSVAGGTNWGDELGDLGDLAGTGYVVVDGPDIEQRTDPSW